MQHHAFFANGASRDNHSSFKQSIYLRYAVQEMFLEARGSYDQAEVLILEQLEEAPDSQMLLKRQVALEKTRGNLSGAIETLRKYVETFQTDREAWEELGHLYLEVRPAMSTVQSLHAIALLCVGAQSASCCIEHALPCMHYEGCSADQTQDEVCFR